MKYANPNESTSTIQGSKVNIDSRNIKTVSTIKTIPIERSKYEKTTNTFNTKHEKENN